MTAWIAQPVADQRDPALDGLRGSAVLLVFLFHYGGGLRAHTPLLRFAGYLTQAGWIGVEIFFALSGFLITSLLLRDTSAPHHLRNFYARRALRILPLYTSALLLCALAALASGAHAVALKPILVYACFLQNVPSLVNTALHTPPPLPLHHLWSLAVEVQFYLFWPLALLVARTPRRVLLMSLCAFGATFLLRIVLFSQSSVSDARAVTMISSLPLRAGALLLGSALACIPQHQIARLRAGAASATLALAVFLLAGWHAHTLLLDNPLAYTVGLASADLLAVALVALCLEPGRMRRLLSAPALKAFGRVSYGFYVFHILLEPAFDHLGAILTGANTGLSYQAARLLCALPITWAVSWLSFHLLEEPFLQLARRFPQPRAVTPLRP